MKKFILFAAVVFLFAGCGKSGKEVATVNGTAITEAEFKMEVDNLPSQYKMMAESPDMKKAIIDNLVITELLTQRAEKEGLLDDPDVQKRIKDKKSSIKAEAEEQIFMLKKQKENAEKIAEREIVLQEMLEGREFKDVKVPEKKIKEQYNNYVQRMKQQNPGADVPALSDIKDKIRVSIARQIWLEDLKAEADVSVNEEFIGTRPAGLGMPGGNIQPGPPASANKK